MINFHVASREKNDHRYRLFDWTNSAEMTQWKYQKKFFFLSIYTPQNTYTIQYIDTYITISILYTRNRFPKSKNQNFNLLNRHELRTDDQFLLLQFIHVLWYFVFDDSECDISPFCIRKTNVCTKIPRNKPFLWHFLKNKN